MTKELIRENIETIKLNKAREEAYKHCAIAFIKIQNIKEELLNGQ